VDETYVGGQTEKQALVAIAVEVHEPNGRGRVRLRRVPDASASSLLPFVREALESGAEVRTDGCGGYSGLAKHRSWPVPRIPSSVVGAKQGSSASPLQ